MLIKFYNLEDTAQLEGEISARDTLVKIADVGEGEEYNPYDFSSVYYLDAYPIACGVV